VRELCEGPAGSGAALASSEWGLAGWWMDRGGHTRKSAAVPYPCLACSSSAFGASMDALGTNNEANLSIVLQLCAACALT
jgi:hypothetical protein